LRTRENIITCRAEAHFTDKAKTELWKSAFTHGRIILRSTDPRRLLRYGGYDPKTR
jgi:hypothetical protein